MECAECGRIAEPDAKGWGAYLGRVDEDDETPVLIFYCPECAEIEFGSIP